jgi:hypothetical protein
VNYSVKVSFRATENEARILRAIQRKNEAESLSEALRAVIAKAAQELAPSKPEQRPEGTTQ